MEPILYFRPGTCSLAELIVLEWIGEPYTLCSVSREQQQTPPYKKLSPHGTVPAMRFGDVAVFENSALLNYLADTHRALRLSPPAGTLERAQLDQWLSYLDSGFHAAHTPYFRPARFLDDESKHPAIRELGKRRIAEHLAFLEAHLAGRDHFFGTSRTVLDAYVPAMARWGRKEFDYKARFPALDRYLLRMDQDAGVQRALAIETGKQTAPSGAFRGFVALE